MQKKSPQTTNTFLISNVFYFLVFLSLTITVCGLRIGLLRTGFSHLSQTLIIAIPSLMWVYILWIEYQPSNDYLAAASLVAILEVALWLSNLAVQRYLNVTIKL